MSIRRIRLAIPAWLTLVLVALGPLAAVAQNANTQQQQRQRNSAVQQGPNATGRSRTSQNANQSRQQPARMAGRPNGAMGKRPLGAVDPKQQGATGANPQANAAPMVMEKLDPEKKAAFLKLIGANWIWSPAHKKDEVPVGDCYFRKTFELNQADFGQVHVACDNQYELYVNGRLVGKGGDWRKMDVHEVTPLLVHGTNVIAIKATNTDAGAAGLVARVIVKERGDTYESFSTDATWKSSVKHFNDWGQARMRDAEWLPAKVYGPLGGVLPWGDEIVIAE
jgi:hypothetical protein